MSLTDRWGAQSDEDVTIERFAALFDDLDPEDEEHCCVSIESFHDEHEWFVEFYTDRVALGNEESGELDDVGTMPLKDRNHALSVAAEFIAGDLATLRDHPWT